ncbi:MAG: type IV pilus twitching motility protein PilT [Planctomycetia bacterium]|nr:type IV pilus twitching motility protein PilT [Planctomycetia bacterium]
MDLAELLAFVKQSGASDLYVSAGAQVMMRVHGDVVPLTVPDVPPTGVPKELVQQTLYEVLTDSQKKKLEEHLELDCALSLHDVARFRVNVFFHERGMGAVFRIIPSSVPTFASLALPDVIARFAERPHGLVLVTGPTGSGKSTTLAAMVDWINEREPGHIITVEDPIEFVHRPKACMVHQRELGANTKSFTAALRASLREDPDVILVGEMRDLETIELALTAAETGHLVLATLHTVSAWKTVDRIVSVFPADQQEQIRTQLAGSLEGIVAQVLLPRADKPGRVAAHEICVATPAVKALIRDGKVHQIQTAIQTGTKLGMQTLSGTIARLAMEGKITKQVAEQAQLDYCGAIDLVAPAGAPPSTSYATAGAGGASAAPNVRKTSYGA